MRKGLILKTKNYPQEVEKWSARMFKFVIWNTITKIKPEFTC